MKLRVLQFNADGQLTVERELLEDGEGDAFDTVKTETADGWVTSAAPSSGQQEEVYFVNGPSTSALGLHRLHRDGSNMTEVISSDDFRSISLLVGLDGFVIGQGTTAAEGTELFVYDITNDAYSIIDIETGTGSSDPIPMVECGGNVVVQYKTGSTTRMGIVHPSSATVTQIPQGTATIPDFDRDAEDYRRGAGCLNNTIYFAITPQGDPGPALARTGAAGGEAVITVQVFPDNIPGLALDPKRFFFEAAGRGSNAYDGAYDALHFTANIPSS